VECGAHAVDIEIAHARDHAFTREIMSAGIAEPVVELFEAREDDRPRLQIGMHLLALISTRQERHPIHDPRMSCVLWTSHEQQLRLATDELRYGAFGCSLSMPVERIEHVLEDVIGHRP
jgi:hypothetical protein